jgi:hypothetical protein
MKISLAILLITNLLSLAGLFLYKHNLDSMNSVVELERTLKQEFLMTAPIKFPDGYTRLFATPTIFRSLEKCVKYANDWNLKPIFPGNVWSCEKYEN